MRESVLPRPLAAGLLLTLAACSGANPAPPAAGPATAPVARSGQPPANQCQAQAAQALVGQVFAPDSLEQARAAAGADEARALRPDSTVTKEFKAGRLNVVVGPDGRIARVHCG